MRNHVKTTSSRASFHQLIAATLTMGGVSLLSPMLASAQTATAAGTQILNTATGTYEDPNAPGVRINTTSNTVTVTVAEIAGITNVPAGLTDLNGGSVTTNDAVNYSFLITNTGNDKTFIQVPTSPTIAGGILGTTGSNATTGQLAAGVYVTEINGFVLTTPVPLVLATDTTNLGSTGNPAFITRVNAAGYPPAGGGFNGTINISSSIKVVVPVTVTATVAGTPVSVTLGDTAPNNNSAGTQNQPFSLSIQVPPQDVFTVDPGDTLSQPGLPVNGVREAAAFQSVLLATQVNNLALATVLKTRTAYSDNSTPNTLADDSITYRLDLRVESSSGAAAGATPSPLLGTAINLDSSGSPNGIATSQTRILVSDAIPAQTTLDTTFGAATVTIGGVVWTRVYTTDPTTINPLAATWRTNATLPVGVTRIGYIANGPLATSYTTVTDLTNILQFRVITSGLTVTGGTIANIAQVFGQTTAGVVSPTNPLVYDESGDQDANNYNGNTPPTPIVTPGSAPTGVANPATDGTDGTIGNNATGNTNTGTGPGGEDNVFTIAAIVPPLPPGSILNGPPSQPAALGPDGANQTDFFNKSADVATNIPRGTLFDPAVVTLTNTVQNPPSNTSALANVTLEPISAALAAKAVNNTISPSAANVQAFDSSNIPNHAVLISGTVVTISFGGRTATYTYDGTNFNRTSSTTGGTPDPTFAPIIIPSLAVGISQTYTVTVDLPAGSTVTTGYSVPIAAYVNSNTGNDATTGAPGAANLFKLNGTAAGLLEDGPFNVTIDRVYTGYLDLFKESRILQGSGPAVQGTDGTFSSPTVAPFQKSAPGNIIEYRITYKNISIPGTGGLNNVLLNANNIVITEDGAAGGNNWATLTLNVASQAADATAGAVITFFNGGTASTTTDVNVTRYIDSIPTLAPNNFGIFTFQRQK